jgi:outer membrane lipoprotein carrier protein
MSAAPIVRRAACLLLAAGFPALLSAQSPTVKELAARIDHHYDSLHTLKASFTESYAGMGTNRNESGTLSLEKPGRMRWDYDSPRGKVFLLDGKYGWFYTPGAPQVQRVPAKQLDDLQSPLRFLLGHTDLEKELTGLHEAPDASRAGALTLIGQPKGQENRVSRVTLSVDPATGAIGAMEIDETSGAITRFTFADQKPDAALPAVTFHFAPPPGVPVVDSMPPV